MQNVRSTWVHWSRELQKWDLKRPAAIVVEAAGPMMTLLAQLMYLGKPFLNGVLPAGQWEELAQTLENPEDRDQFAAFLREEDEGAS